jgi:hypothetical protein
LKRKTTDAFRKHPADAVANGVLASLTGRIALFGAFGISFALAGLPLQAFLFAAAIVVDAFIHLQAVVLLGRTFA